MNLFFKIAAIALLSALPGLAHAQSYIRIPTCGTASPPTGSSAGYMDATGNICGKSASGSPNPVTTTSATVTIAVTNTFQTALAASNSRQGCLLQYHPASASNVGYAFFGAGTPTLATSFQLGNATATSISCAVLPNGISVDQISVTGTATDTFTVTSQ